MQSENGVKKWSGAAQWRLYSVALPFESGAKSIKYIYGSIPMDGTKFTHTSSVSTDRSLLSIIWPYRQICLQIVCGIINLSNSLDKY